MTGPPTPKRAKLSKKSNIVKNSDNFPVYIQDRNQCINQDATRRKRPRLQQTIARIPIKGASDLPFEIISKILRYQCFVANDLLSFRLVNNSWRQSATNILLERNLCHLEFTTTNVLAPGANIINPKATNHVYCNARKPKAVLSELNDIISRSLQFPTTSLRFINESAFGNDSYLMDLKELLKFFNLYGHKIQSLYLGNYISMKELRDVLLKYTCKLNFLDVSSLTIFRPSWNSMKKTLNFPQGAPFTSTLKTIYLGSSLLYNCYDPERYKRNRKIYTPDAWEIDERANLCNLIKAADNLEQILDVSIENLSCLLELKKAHLIQELDFNPPLECKADIFFKFLCLKPRLTSLKVNLDNCDSELITPKSEKYPGVAAIITGLIDYSRYSLKYLEVHVNPFDFPQFIGIPPLKNLTTIKFSESCRQFGIKAQAGNDDRTFIFIDPTKKRSQGSHFPNLEKVILDVLNYSEGGKLMGFFCFRDVRQSDESECEDKDEYEQDSYDLKDKDNEFIIPSVKVVEIQGEYWPTSTEIKDMESIFTCVKTWKWAWAWYD